MLSISNQRAVQLADNIEYLVVGSNLLFGQKENSLTNEKIAGNYLYVNPNEDVYCMSVGTTILVEKSPNLSYVISINGQSGVVEIPVLTNESIKTEYYKKESITKEKLSSSLQSEIGSGGLTEEAVETKYLKNLAVTEAKIGAEAVAAAKVKSEAIETSKIKLLAITEALLGSESVAEGKIKNLAVGSGKLASGAVTESKLGSEAVATAKIKLLNITEALLASEAVGEAKLKSEAVSEAKLTSAVKTKLKGASRSERTFTASASVETKAEVIGKFYAAVAASETKKLIGMKYGLLSGTKAKFSIKQNGTAVTNFKELEAKSAEELAVSGKEVSVSDLDRFELVVESIEGTPKGIYVTLFFESTH